MPTYEYECEECGCRFEVRQRFSDKPIEKCQGENCKGKVHKVFSPPAIIFKGSGFHVNDYGRGSSGNNGRRKPDNCASCESNKECPKAAATSGD
jgi:putative FmdB family regulatory protein